MEENFNLEKLKSGNIPTESLSIIKFHVEELGRTFTHFYHNLRLLNARVKLS